MRYARLDIAEVQSAVRTNNGFLKAPCLATRAGVFVYANPDGSARRELRPPDEVFKPASLQTLAAVPVTDEHPENLVSPSNASMFAKGVTGEVVEQDREFVKCSITVFDEKLINLLENKEKRELSCGYTCDVEDTPGVFQGEKYDAIQRNIKYNHLAVVTKGRAGPEVRVRIDGAEYAHQLKLDTASTANTDNKGTIPMAKIRVDNAEYEVSEGVAVAVGGKLKADETEIEALSTKLAALSDELEKLKGQYAAKTMEADGLQKKVQEVEGEKMDSAKVHKLVQARLALVKRAEPFLTSSVKADSLDDKQIKVEVIKTRVPEFKADAHTDLYIDGLFEGLTASAAGSRTDALATSVNDARSVPVSSAADARKRAMDEAKNAWKRA